MKQGTLIYDRESGRYDIRFGLDDYNGGLHCGECFGKWGYLRMIFLIPHVGNWLIERIALIHYMIGNFIRS